MGCPSGIGPEVVLGACLKRGAPPALIVGDRGVLIRAAVALGWPKERIQSVPDYDPNRPLQGLQIVSPGPALGAADRKWGKPSPAGGRAQLEYIEHGYRLAHYVGLPLVTAPVSKEVIAHSGLKRAKSFRGHTEWLEALDGAQHSVMCFAADAVVTSLVTTHLPLSQVPAALTPAAVTRAIIELADLMLRLGFAAPRIAVCSVNPHAGEGELLGSEERTAIVPGISRATRLLGGRAHILGPVGAETAFRKAVSDGYDGVVAMYHDQATIPMKLIDFGGTVNVTQGLSIVRTSVDHGTAYDIAGKGIADARGMASAIALAGRLGSAPRQAPPQPW